MPIVRDCAWCFKELSRRIAEIYAQVFPFVPYNCINRYVSCVVYNDNVMFLLCLDIAELEHFIFENIGDVMEGTTPRKINSKIEEYKERRNN